MSEPFRTASGGRVDRASPVAFRFDARSYRGLAGDTLASALLANGVHLVGRSFKYHRPRGILSAGSDEPNALVGVGPDEVSHVPNLRATQVEIHEGLVAASQNRNPSLRFDRGALNGFLAPFIPAGFYYKTFLWPRRAWARFYEPRIRAMAGLGRAPTRPDRDHYAQTYAHCDVLVVGAGPAGIAAALAAAAGHARVILCDEQAEPGGSLLAETAATIAGHPAQGWLAECLARLAREPRVRVLRRTTAFGYFAHNFVGLSERLTDHLADPDPLLPRERLWQVRAREVVLATGALERPLVFPENDRPGIMLAEAARIYLARYGVKPGGRAVVATAHDGAYRAALDLHRAGVGIAAIADLRADPQGPLIAEARAAGLTVLPATSVNRTKGHLRVRAAQLARIDGTGRATPGETLACDLLLMSGGFTPAVHLFSQSRGSLVFDPGAGAFLPARPAERCRSAGACRGTFGLAAALAEGYAAGEAASAASGRGGAPGLAIAVSGAAEASGGTLGAMPHARDSNRVKAFVDFQNDVTAKDVTLAVREGFRSIEHIKRYTTTGMATDQGKTSNMNALAIASGALGKPLPQVGLTTFRMPYTPVTFGVFAGFARGELFDPLRRTPIDPWAEAQGAVFEPVGQWRRARHFPRGAEDLHQAVAREVRAVRGAVGIFDASTLGKIEVVGPDAAEFMNRMYINAWTKLAPGRARYGVMLREDGFVMDDGVVGRIALDRFHVTTTTGGAVRVLSTMEDYLQTEWPDLDVWLTSTTEQWAVIALQGPRARAVLAPLVEGQDIAREAFPHMAVAGCRVAGVPARLFRVSFSGELGFEVNVPADYGPGVWQAILAEGRRFGIIPYGTETMHVLRAEKGYIIVGQDTDGTATPDDVGLGGMIGKAKRDFVGARSLRRAAMAAPDRKQLVGLLTADPGEVLEEGAQIVADPKHQPPVPMLGHVTSAYFSPSAERSIALAMLRGGRARMGETLFVSMPGRVIAVTVTRPVFYDPAGAHLDD